MQLVGLYGALAGQVARVYPAGLYSIGQGAGGQFIWGFGSPSAVETGQALRSISQHLSMFSFGGEIGDALGRSINQAVSHAPRVGGILFENCAAELTDIGELVGAYWDTRSASLVLLGRSGNRLSLAGLSLPSMDREHLAVALRASLTGQPIGVSIDPPAEYRDRIRGGVTPPDGTLMLVSYLGHTEGTLFGAIMFEADRLLKCLDKGVHNETRRPVRATVSGFKPLLEMIHPGDGRPADVWHRFWFVIEKVELKHDSGSGAIAFGDVRLKVLTETEMDGQPKGQYLDPADQAFTSHLTEHYDEYAEDFPILARLKELAKVAAIAKLLVNLGVALDPGSLFESPGTPVDTPSTTPGISVTSPNVQIRQEGNVIHRRSVSLFGGVDMDAQPNVLPDDGTANHLRNSAEAARPTPGAPSWTFRRNGTVVRALAIRLGPPRSPYRRVCDDHESARNAEGDLLRLRRVYDLGSSRQGDFGPGWFLWIPYSLVIVPDTGRKRREVLTPQETDVRPRAPVLVLLDHVSYTSSIYRRTDRRSSDGRDVFCRVTSQTLSKDRASGKTCVSFEYDASDEIQAQGDHYWLRRKERRYCFNASGLLVEAWEGDRNVVQYHREKGRIVRVGLGSALAYAINHDKVVPGRITEIRASDGQVLRYLYDEQGRLLRCTAREADVESYAYDVQGRLTEVRDRSGRVVSRIVYDEHNEPVAAPSDVVMSPSGRKVRRAFERGNLVSARDEAGVALRLQYGDDGSVSAVKVGSRADREWQLMYDTKGRLSRFQNPQGEATCLEYDESGSHVRVTVPQGGPRCYQLDDRGRLAAVVEQDGREWVAEYDDTDKVRSVRGPDGQRWSYQYAGQMLVRVRGTDGEVRVRPRSKTLAVQTIAPNGMWGELVFDHARRLTRQHVSGSKPVRFRYAKEGSSFSVSSQAGTMRYEVDEDGLTVNIVFYDFSTIFLLTRG